MGTDTEVRQRRGGRKSQDAVTGKVVQGDELVTSGLSALKNIHHSLSGQVSRRSTDTARPTRRAAADARPVPAQVSAADLS